MTRDPDPSIDRPARFRAEVVHPTLRILKTAEDIDPLITEILESKRKTEDPA
jgi:hypothetical protein